MFSVDGPEATLTLMKHDQMFSRGQLCMDRMEVQVTQK
jgi:hypothetical protein